MTETCSGTTSPPPGLAQGLLKGAVRNVTLLGRGSFPLSSVHVLLHEDMWARRSLWDKGTHSPLASGCARVRNIRWQCYVPGNLQMGAPLAPLGAASPPQLARPAVLQ